MKRTTTFYHSLLYRQVCWQSSVKQNANTCQDVAVMI